MQGGDCLLPHRPSAQFGAEHSHAVAVTLVMTTLLNGRHPDEAHPFATIHGMLCARNRSNRRIPSQAAFESASSLLGSEFQLEFSELVDAVPPSGLVRCFAPVPSSTASLMTSELKCSQFGRVYLQMLAESVASVERSGTMVSASGFGRCSLSPLLVIGPLTLVEALPDSGHTTAWGFMSRQSVIRSLIQYMDTIILEGEDEEGVSWRLNAVAWRYQYVINSKSNGPKVKHFDRILGITFMCRSADLDACLNRRCAISLTSLRIIPTGQVLRSVGRWSFAATAHASTFLRFFGAAGDSELLSPTKSENLTVLETWAEWPELFPHPAVPKEVFPVLQRLRQHVKKQQTFAVVGPPGTGKTTLITALIACTVHFQDTMNKEQPLRCMVLADSNVACDVLEKRLTGMGLRVVRMVIDSRMECRRVSDCAMISNRDSDAIMAIGEDVHSTVLVCSLGRCGAPSTPYADDLRGLLGLMDIVLIDESGQSSPSKAAHVLMMMSARGSRPGHCGVIGDSRQLAQYNITGIEIPSLLRCVLCSLSPMLLDLQMRMPAALGSMISACFYENRLMNGLRPKDTVMPMIGIQCDGPECLEAPAERSDSIEAMVAVELAVAIKSAGHDVVILTCYGDQRRKINELIPKRIQQISVYTVDGFQGEEKDIVIFSCGRGKGVGFAADRRRLNVAMSRAKRGLLLLHNSCLFGSPLWRYVCELLRSADAYWIPKRYFPGVSSKEFVKRVGDEGTKWFLGNSVVNLEGMKETLSRPYKNEAQNMQAQAKMTIENTRH